MTFVRTFASVFAGFALAGASVSFASEPVPDGTAVQDAVEEAVEKAVKPIAPERLKDPKFVLGHDAKRIDGKKEKLAKYDGKVILIVNVASKCGFTKQYKDLEAMYKKYKDQGLVIIGFPCNQFGGQEPGTSKEILEFCESRFDVTFPMFDKVDVKGEKAHPLFKQLAKQDKPIGGVPKWNFTKYLVGRDGRVIDRYNSRVKPTDKKVVEKIEKLLAGKQVEVEASDAGV